MAKGKPGPEIQGELQRELMEILWRQGPSSVEDVRGALPAADRGAYTTVQTVLNRLAERGLLSRDRRGKSIVYSPRVSEGEYLSGSLQRALSQASPEARQSALASLVGGLGRDERQEINELLGQIQRRRGKKR